MDTRQKIINFAKDNRDVKKLKFILDDPDGVIIKEISGEGILNYVYRVQSVDGQDSVILKHGHDTAKYSSKEEVSLDRQTVEYEALKLFNDVCPGLAPEPYCLDKQHHFIAMEDLSHMHLLETELSAGKVDLDLASKLGQVLAILHRSTKKENLSAERHQQLKSIFGDPNFKKDRVHFRLTQAFAESGGVNKVQAECQEMYRNTMEEITSQGILDSLRALMLETTSLVHSDCHPKSIFVLEDQFMIFDLEWACLGNPKYDVGFSLAWYIIFMIGNCSKPGATTNQQRTLQAIGKMLNTYIDESEEREIGPFLQAVAGFMGATIFSLANFIWMDQFMTVDLECKLSMMEIGTTLMRAFASQEIKDIQGLLDVIACNFKPK